MGQTHSEHAPGGVPAPVVGMGQNHPDPLPAADQNALGRGIQRTMTLLATSTPEHRNHVKILFYGQSITEQEWAKAVADDLRKRFPNADMDIQNKAIGGFASDLLIRSAEADVYPWYPDLVIFHVYGAHDKYDEIMRRIRTRTTAEVVMQKDHVTAWPDPAAVSDRNKSLWWDSVMNDRELPAISQRWGCGLADIRTGWVNYLKAQHVEPKALLKDGVHLNEWGNFLMAKLVSQYLVYRADSPPGDWQHLVVDMPVKAGDWKDGTLTIPFDGNRVDAVLNGPGNDTADVLIDGQKPSAFDGCYAFSRPQPNPWAGPFFIDQIHHDANLLVESWTYTVHDVRDNGKAWTFSVRGSVTGDDGSGDTTKTFISNSRRVHIEPEDYFRGFSPPLPPGATLTWRVDPYFADVLASDPSAKEGAEHSVILAQGISNDKHTLTIHGPVAALKAIRVYRPSIKGEPKIPLPSPQ